jgi:hypothetical protein
MSIFGLVTSSPYHVALNNLLTSFSEAEARYPAPNTTYFLFYTGLPNHAQTMHIHPDSGNCNTCRNAG